MDNTFDESDFAANQDLQARESKQSSESSQEDIAGSIQEKSKATDSGEAMDFRKFWESRYGRELSEFELQECRDNVVGFLNVLAEWDDKMAGE
ncbi:MAG: hypothetical protein OXF24_02565 [Hyphomicrobiales bacterium]|nr:hypothetical protein [Hyphomicrobiales bacterium]